jgi:thioredoxin
MGRYLSAVLAVSIIMLSSCLNGQNARYELDATEFAGKIKELPAATILDVRTPQEFNKGHLPDAINIDWYDNDFQKQIALLDKSGPVFVYCLSGARSAAAARLMRSQGFNTVYELSGGMMKWRAANLPETTSGNPSKGMSKQEFDALLESDKSVLIDFYADWCAPCKKMKPYLDEISKEMADQVVVIRINADDNQQLCKILKVDTLPVLQLYKNKSLVWTNTGFISKEEVVKQIQLNK